MDADVDLLDPEGKERYRFEASCRRRISWRSRNGLARTAFEAWQFQEAERRCRDVAKEIPEVRSSA